MNFIILDRDGVINYDSAEYIKSPDEWQPIPGSLEAITKLNQHEFRPLIATNQSGLARGYFNLDTLNAIHNKMRDQLAVVGGFIEEIFFCPHQPSDVCACRKPKPGLIFQMLKKYSLDLPKTFFIGDSFGDIQAARTAECQPILVKTGKGLETLTRYPELQDIPQFEDLASAVDYVLERQGKSV